MTSISTSAIFRQLGGNIQSLQRSMLEAQKEVSTGVKSDIIAAFADGGERIVDLRNLRLGIEEMKGGAELVASRLETVQQALAGIRQVTERFRDQVLVASDPISRRYLQDAAQLAIEQVTALLNTQIGGRYLFSGIAVETRPIQGAATVNPATGVSPGQVVAQVIATQGPIVDAASALAVANGPDGIATVFDDTHSNPNFRYASTFYNAATGGAVTAHLEAGLDLDYGARADQPGIRDLLEGLHMLAGLPYATVPDDAYGAWQSAAFGRIAGGLQQVIDLAGEVGSAQQVVAESIERHEAALTQLSTQVVRLEQADPFESATRLSILQTQLEATFSITARISRLSLINYL